jgi:hypothetical protein
MKKEEPSRIRQALTIIKSLVIPTVGRTKFYEGLEKEHGIHQSTLERAVTILKEAPPEVSKAVETGKMRPTIVLAEIRERHAKARAEISPKPVQTAIQPVKMARLKNCAGRILLGEVRRRDAFAMSGNLSMAKAFSR